MNIFIILDYLNNEIKDIKETIVSYNNYLGDILFLNYENMLEIKYCDELSKENFLKYVKLVSNNHKTYLNTCLNEINTLDKKLNNLINQKTKLINIIAKLSNLNYLDFRDLCSIYHLKCKYIHSSIYLNNHDNLILNPVYNNIFNPDVLDFLNFYINAKYYHLKGDLFNLYIKYENLKELPMR